MRVVSAWLPWMSGIVLRERTFYSVFSTVFLMCLYC